MHKLLGITLALLLLSALTGCEGRPTPETRATATVTNTVLPTETGTLQPTATATQTSTPVPTRIPGSFNAAPETDLIFAGQIEGICELPCWHNLVIGDSTLGDFSTIAPGVFQENTYLYTSDYLDFRIGYNLPTGDYVGVEYEEQTLNSRTTIAGISTETDDGLLALIVSHYDPLSETTYVFHSPAVIIERLGEPASIRIEALELPPNAPGDGLIRFYLLYEEGVIFFLVGNTTGATYCLATPVSIEEMYLVEPFDADFTGLLDLHRAILQRVIPGQSYRTTQEWFNLTPADITQRILDDGDLCLQLAPE